MKKSTELLLLIGAAAAGVWWLNRNTQPLITLYIPKFHRGEAITPIAGDGTVYVITDVYYNSGRWIYALESSGETHSYFAEVVDKDYVLFTGVA